MNRHFGATGAQHVAHAGGQRSFSHHASHQTGGNRNNSVFFGNKSPFGNYGNNWGHQHHHHGHNGGGYGGYGGYGFGRGYRGYGRYGYWPFFFGWPFLGYGYGGYGNGGYGYGGYGGYGYGGYGNGGYGYGSGYGYPNGYATNAYAAAPVVDPALAAGAVAADGSTAGIDYATQGEAHFRAGDFQAAAGDLRHALVDAPENAGLVMMLGQALFATGQYPEAAGATQMALGMLPEDKWGAVVENYTQLYGNIQDYTNQLRALEVARNQKPDDPALRFLLGFHFGYLGYPKEAVRELTKGVQLEGRDPAMRKLHDLFAAKIGAPEVGPPPQAGPGGPGAGGPGAGGPAAPTDSATPSPPASGG